MKHQIKATGTCLCKAVHIEVESFAPHVDACHCSMCRKWGGGPLLAIDAGTQLIVRQGADKVASYQSSPWAKRGFCQQCGTHLFYLLTEAQRYIVPVGVLDTNEALSFSTQIFIEEKPEYYAFANETKTMTGAEVFAQN